MRGYGVDDEQLDTRHFREVTEDLAGDGRGVDGVVRSACGWPCLRGVVQHWSPDGCGNRVAPNVSVVLGIESMRTWLRRSLLKLRECLGHE